MNHKKQYAIGTLDLCGRWFLAWTTTPLPVACSQGSAIQSGLVFYPCVVPGNFELDLFKLGKLPEPFFGLNPIEVRMKTENCHVYYTRRFTAEQKAGAHAVLVFEGLDCFADIFIDGALAASFDNMLIEHEVPLDPFLTSGDHELFIHIRPAVQEAGRYEYTQFNFSHALGYESLHVRKAPHMYGWDIMPRFVSAGIYRPVRIEYRPGNRIEELYLKTAEISEDHRSARLILYYRLSEVHRDNVRVTLKMSHGCSAVTAETAAFFHVGNLAFDIQDPQLWWPKGRGEASLYDVEVTLSCGGESVDVCRFRHGIRVVRLKRTSFTTESGEGEFVFIINNERVFIKGTNWVPADAFHSRDKARIPKILDMVNDLNCNMVRCWGGNVYEDDLFYDKCDQWGLLVWQDFSMACGIYPQDDLFAQKISEEATIVIKRLRSHACIILWAGDNECDWAYLWAKSNVDPNTNILTRKILPEAVRRHDGTRPYLGSSPFFDQDAADKGADFLTEMHLWGPRGYFKDNFYTGSLCHFVSEIGYHGCPAPESIEKFISKDKLWPYKNNEEWILHATSPVPDMHVYDDRISLMSRQILTLFTDLPDNLSDFSFASQIVQAEALKFFIEMFRRLKWRRTGIIWWNICDGWPQFSDAVVDYYFNRKRAYESIKTCQQDVLVLLDEPRNGMQDVVVSNDTSTDKTFICQVQDIDTGKILFESQGTAYRDQSTVIGQMTNSGDRQMFFSIAWQGEICGQNHYLAGQPPFELARVSQWLKKYDDIKISQKETYCV